MLNLFQHPGRHAIVAAMEREPCVYILASDRMGTLYIGVTSDLAARLHQHRTGVPSGFASRYGATRLVWFEMADDMATAIAREKQLKRWRRDWKINLIERDNPEWMDLSIGLGIATDHAARGSLDLETSSG